MREYGVYEAKTKLPDLIRFDTERESGWLADNRGYAAIKAMRTGTIGQAEFLSM